MRILSLQDWADTRRLEKAQQVIRIGKRGGKIVKEGIGGKRQYLGRKAAGGYAHLYSDKSLYKQTQRTGWAKMKAGAIAFVKSRPGIWRFTPGASEKKVKRSEAEMTEITNGRVIVVPRKKVFRARRLNQSEVKALQEAHQREAEKGRRPKKRPTKGGKTARRMPELKSGSRHPEGTILRKLESGVYPMKRVRKGRRAWWEPQIPESDWEQLLHPETGEFAKPVGAAASRALKIVGKTGQRLPREDVLGWAREGVVRGIQSWAAGNGKYPIASYLMDFATRYATYGSRIEASGLTLSARIQNVLHVFIGARAKKRAKKGGEEPGIREIARGMRLKKKDATDVNLGAEGEETLPMDDWTPKGSTVRYSGKFRGRVSYASLAQAITQRKKFSFEALTEDPMARGLLPSSGDPTPEELLMSLPKRKMAREFVEGSIDRMQEPYRTIRRMQWGFHSEDGEAANVPEIVDAIGLGTSPTTGKEYGAASKRRIFGGLAKETEEEWGKVVEAIRKERERGWESHEQLLNAFDVVQALKEANPTETEANALAKIENADMAARLETALRASNGEFGEKAIVEVASRKMGKKEFSTLDRIYRSERYGGESSGKLFRSHTESMTRYGTESRVHQWEDVSWLGRGPASRADRILTALNRGEPVSKKDSAWLAATAKKAKKAKRAYFRKRAMQWAGTTTRLQATPEKRSALTESYDLAGEEIYGAPIPEMGNPINLSDLDHGDISKSSGVVFIARSGR